MTATFQCTSCGRPSDLSAAGFLYGSGVPHCPCQDVITCADCGATFADDYAWVRHCVEDHWEQSGPATG